MCTSCRIDSGSTRGWRSDASASPSGAPRERRAALVNFAAAGFALTVMVFYFETVMTKMGRAASLIGLGALFLVGGYLLERLRRRMVGNLKGERP